VKLTDHLTLDELACRDGTAYPEEWVEERAARLAQMFEGVRAGACEAVGRDCPIVILSGYRTRKWNRKVGGAKNSFHTQGLAIDMGTPRLFVAKYVDRALDKFWALAYHAATESIGDIRGLGRYPWGVHMDLRPAPRLVVFRGVRPDADAPRDA
jgi:uncharacterized protein YcbK (DUF882 family)